MLREEKTYNHRKCSTKKMNKKKKVKCSIYKTIINMVDTNQNISVVNFNVNCLNATKRQQIYNFFKFSK